MKTSRTNLGMLVALASVLYFAGPSRASAQPKTQAPEWNVEVDRVSPGEASIDPAFQVAIYESLVDEVAKTKRFKQVFRSGNRKASEAADVLILKTTVEKYTAGSETRRAVTTFGGATKLRVKSQLCRKDGQVLFEWVVNGNVRFIGGNLRATHTLAKNEAKKLKAATLPNPGLETPSQASSRDSAQAAYLSGSRENLDRDVSAAVEVER